MGWPSARQKSGPRSTRARRLEGLGLPQAAGPAHTLPGWRLRSRSAPRVPAQPRARNRAARHRCRHAAVLWRVWHNLRTSPRATADASSGACPFSTNHLAAALPDCGAPRIRRGRAGRTREASHRISHARLQVPVLGVCACVCVCVCACVRVSVVRCLGWGRAGATGGCGGGGRGGVPESRATGARSPRNALALNRAGWRAAVCRPHICVRSHTTTSSAGPFFFLRLLCGRATGDLERRSAASAAFFLSSADASAHALAFSTARDLSKLVERAAPPAFAAMRGLARARERRPLLAHRERGRAQAAAAAAARRRRRELAHLPGRGRMAPVSLRLAGPPPSWAARYVQRCLPIAQGWG